MAGTVKNLPFIQETQVRFLGWEDPLEKGMATHSSILAWRIPWTEEPGGPQSTRPPESHTTEATEHALCDRPWKGQKEARGSASVCTRADSQLPKVTVPMETG